MITYDAVVTGSGSTGGWAAKELTEKGLATLVVERGRNVEHRKDYITEHKPSWELPLRNARLAVGTRGAEEYPIQARTGQFHESVKHFFIKDHRNPYIEDKPFTWIQGDQVGGKSLIWGRQVYRWSDLDFEANLRDGHGVDWPIRYADVAPWYSYVERFIGVSGEKLGLPQLPDGEFQPPMEMNAGEKFVKAGLERAFPDRRFTIGRVAILTQPLNDRLPCHYCGPCERGCSTGSYFSSQASTLPAARATGRLTIVPDSVVHSLIYDAAKSRVTGVRVVDTTTKQTREYSGRLVFLCASTLATTRVLLNSKSPSFPNGLANSSGVLGHYLMDHHFRAGASGTIEGLLDHYYQGNRPNGIYVPRFRNLGDEASRRGDYVRGFGYQGGASRQNWARGAAEPGFGVELKRKLHDPGRWTMGITRRTTSPTCSSPMARAWPARRASTRPSRTWRSPRAPATTPWQNRSAATCDAFRSEHDQPSMVAPRARGLHLRARRPDAPHDVRRDRDTAEPAHRRRARRRLAPFVRRPYARRMARPGLRHRADGALEDRGWHDQEDRERQGAPRSGRAAAERRRPDDRGDVRGFRAELGVEGHAGREQRRQVQRLRGAVPSPGRGQLLGDVELDAA